MQHLKNSTIVYVPKFEQANNYPFQYMGIHCGSGAVYFGVSKDGWTEALIECKEKAMAFHLNTFKSASYQESLPALPPAMSMDAKEHEPEIVENVI